MSTKKSIKADFPILKKNKNLIYLDSGATSQKPQVVIDAVNDWYQKYNANVHRGVYELAEFATKKYEDAREKIAKFINADAKEIVFTKGTTESINLVAFSWGRRNLKAGDTVLLTEMEHHANIVPWQELAKIKKIKLKFIPLKQSGELDLQDLPKLLSEVKLISLTYVSNVLGVINPVSKIIKQAKNKNIPVLVDAAQAVPHFAINIKRLKPDWLVFSGHKMLAPTGIGVLYVNKDRYKEMDVYQTGGDMIKKVTLTSSEYAEPPQKFEAGTQNIAGAVGLAAAVDYLAKVGMNTVSRHDQMLGNYALKQLKQIPEVRLLSSRVKKRIASISFVVQSIHPHDLATFLSDKGIAVRAGHHCAMPLHKKLNIPASVRISLYIYNDKNDIDIFIRHLRAIIKKWQKQYG